MQVPKFEFADDEEAFVLKLHNEGFRVNYKKKDEQQLLFNRYYQKCKKRRERAGMPPMFGDRRTKSLPFKPKTVEPASSSHESTEEKTIEENPAGSEKKKV